MRKKYLRFLFQLIFLIIFNVSFFVLGGVAHYISVWISYGFIHFAYFMLVLVPKFTRNGKSSAIFGFSLFAISAAYFFIVFITGMLFILTSPVNHISALLVQLFIVGLYGIIFISHMIANKNTTKAERKRQYQIAYVKDASAKLKTILESITDKDAKKAVEKVYDAIYSSPVKSHPDLMQMETSILQSINELENAVSTENKSKIISLAGSVLRMVNERNIHLKRKN